jgi:putative CocE/NonD family hydrolase
MIGKSWGGFNVLQLAARRPHALRAVISVCASDDRWADDAHYMGGCLLNENLTWGTVLMTFSALPPIRARRRRLARELARTDRRRDAVSPRSGSAISAATRTGGAARCATISGAIACPVYAVGGWADAYTNAIPRLVADLTVPAKGLVGPWGHVYPHRGVPGPAIGFLQEALRWWDRWLKGVETGVLDEPRYRVWMDDRWVAEDAWPSPRITPRRFALAPGRLADDAGADGGARHAIAPVDRRRRRRMVRVRRGRDGRRPARGRRGLARLRLAAARRGARDPRRPRRRARRRRRPAARPRRASA